MVEAMAARAEKPNRVSRARRSSRSLSSPPKRCAQPPMSSRMPSGGSTATSGGIALAPVGDGLEQARVGGLHPPARPRAPDAWRGPVPARGRQSGRGRSAAASTATRRSRLPRLPKRQGRRRFIPLPRDAVGRKPLQPQAQNALRARNAAPHCSTPRSMLRDGHGGCARRCARGARTDAVPSFVIAVENSADAAAPTIQRVAAAEGASSGAVRRMRPSVSPAASASEPPRRHLIDARARISPITTPTARQRNASSIAHSTSRQRPPP